MNYNMLIYDLRKFLFENLPIYFYGCTKYNIYLNKDDFNNIKYSILNLKIIENDYYNYFDNFYFKIFNLNEMTDCYSYFIDNGKYIISNKTINEIKKFRLYTPFIERKPLTENEYIIKNIIE